MSTYYKLRKHYEHDSEMQRIITVLLVAFDGDINKFEKKYAFDIVKEIFLEEPSWGKIVFYFYYKRYRVLFNKWEEIMGENK